jgi:membrane protease YdiL (CAAX protease family)
VGIWIAVGVWFRLGAIPYHVVGVILMLLFQRFVARRPISQLWVRGEATFRCDAAMLVLALVLAALASGAIIFHLGRLTLGKDWWMIPFAALASIPAAFALRHTTLVGLRAALPSVLAALLVGLAWRYIVVLIGNAAGITAPSHVPLTVEKLLPTAVDFLFGFLAAFLIEEVIFRGGLDTHVSSDGKSRTGEFRSAIFVSLLWAVWHLPLQARGMVTPVQQLGVALHVFGIAIGGVPLAFCWRRSGTLVLPAALHAFANARALN